MSDPRTAGAFGSGAGSPPGRTPTTPRGRAGGTRGHRRRRGLPGQPGPAPLRPVRGRPRGAVVEALHACARCMAGHSHGDGWAIVSASPELFLARRGDASGRCPSRAPARAAEPPTARVGQGCRRARHDRGPRAQRPRPRLPARQRPLAGAHARAGRWPAWSTSSRGSKGRLRDGRTLDRAACGDVPGRLGDGRPEDRGARSHPRPGAGRPRAPRWARSGRSGRTATSTWR